LSFIFEKVENREVYRVYAGEVEVGFIAGYSKGFIVSRPGIVLAIDGTTPPAYNGSNCTDLERAKQRFAELWEYHTG